MKKESKQPYRLWFQYLQTCLNHNELSKKVDREFYRSWNLNKVKTERFDVWLKTHLHLFEELNNEIKLFSGGTRTPKTILVEIPTNYNVHKISREIGGVVSHKINKSNARFSITSNRPLQIDKLDYFHWCWELKQQKKYQVYGGLEMIWIALDKKVRGRQTTQQSRVAKGTIRQRFVPPSTGKINRSIYVSRNILKGKKILSNVCKGIFPGLDYSV